MRGRWLFGLCASCALASALVCAAQEQEPSQPQPASPAQLHAAIAKLGDLDYAVRTNASRTVRRTPAAQAVPALVQAVSDEGDGYVRYRALVLLTGFNDPRAKDVMRDALASPNDRLRSVAYSYFEHNPDASIVPMLVGALDKETSEFVRPSLVRALAAAEAAADDPKLRDLLVRESSRGQDFFRSTVIEALGDYKAQYAVPSLIAIAKLDGPLQSDTAIALGKIGDKRALETLASLQRSAPQASQPYIAAGICLLGVNCAAHEKYLIDTLRFAQQNEGFQANLRAAAAGLADVAMAGHEDAAGALVDIGTSAADPTRAPVTLALATIALRDTPLMMSVLEKRRDRDRAIELLAEGFDGLEEDYDKERFFAFVRRTYWSSSDESPTRGLTRTLIGKLDF